MARGGTARGGTRAPQWNPRPTVEPAPHWVFCSAFSDTQHIVDDPRRDVNSGSVDAIAELHGVVDFVDEQLAFHRLKDIDRYYATTDGSGGLDAQIGQFGGDGAVAGMAAAGGVGDP